MSAIKIKFSLLIFFVLFLFWAMYVFFPKDFSLLPGNGVGEIENYSVSREQWPKVKIFLSDLVNLWNHPQKITALDWTKSHCRYWHWNLDAAAPSWRWNPNILQCFFVEGIPLSKNYLSDSAQETKWGNKFILVKNGNNFLHFYLDAIFPPNMEDNDSQRVFQLVLANNSSIKAVKSYAYQVVVRVKEWPTFSLSVFLYPGDDRYLPQAEYFYGQKSKIGSDRDMERGKEVAKKSNVSRSNLRDEDKTVAHEIFWDNFHRHFYIDRHLVTSREIKEWLEFTHQDDVLNHMNHNEMEHDDQPATQLSLRQQKAYCTFRGKKLLTAPLFDAATFYRSGVELQNEWQRSLYPWGNTPLAKMDKLLENQCRFVFSKECLRLTDTTYSLDNISWMGIFQIMGGVPESLDNPIDPFFNLKASSYFTMQNSAWNQLGVRMHWNGKMMDEQEWQNLHSVLGEEVPFGYNHHDPLPIGFRCYFDESEAVE